MINVEEYCSFDDALIEPNFSNVIPTEVNLMTKLTKSIVLHTPIISAPMDTVTEHNMAINMALNGAIGVIHKNLDINLQCYEVSKVKNYVIDSAKYNKPCIDEKGALRVLAAISTGEEALRRLDALIKVNVDAIVIDTSHGYSQNVLSTITAIKSRFANVEIIAGNVVTKNAAFALLEAGVDALKVGIGPGSICTTRIIAGVGFPQLSAILEVAKACKNKEASLIADGGIRFSGDIAKSIAAGADCVMLGSLLAGSDVSPGKVVSINNLKYKEYRGMGSAKAMAFGSADRYFQTVKANLVPQGVEGYVRYKGALKNILSDLSGGLSCAMGYTGNKTIAEMKKNCRLIKITPASIKESHAHSVVRLDQ